MCNLLYFRFSRKARAQTPIFRCRSCFFCGGICVSFILICLVGSGRSLDQINHPPPQCQTVIFNKYLFAIFNNKWWYIYRDKFYGLNIIFIYRYRRNNNYYRLTTYSGCAFQQKTARAIEQYSYRNVRSEYARDIRKTKKKSSKSTKPQKCIFMNKSIKAVFCCGHTIKIFKF